MYGTVHIQNAIPTCFFFLYKRIFSLDKSITNHQMSHELRQKQHVCVYTLYTIVHININVYNWLKAFFVFYLFILYSIRKLHLCFSTWLCAASTISNVVPMYIQYVLRLIINVYHAYMYLCSCWELNNFFDANFSVYRKAFI